MLVRQVAPLVHDRDDAIHELERLNFIMSFIVSELNGARRAQGQDRDRSFWVNTRTVVVVPADVTHSTTVMIDGDSFKLLTCDLFNLGPELFQKLGLGLGEQFLWTPASIVEILIRTSEEQAVFPVRIMVFPHELFPELIHSVDQELVALANVKNGNSCRVLDSHNSLSLIKG